MSYLSRKKQIEIIAALCEGIGQRAVARLIDTDRKTVARLALRVGRGAAELHDRMMVGVRTNRLELDELWAFVQRSRRWHQKPGLDGPVTRGQYIYVAMPASSRAIISYLTGKRSTENTDTFIQDSAPASAGFVALRTVHYQ
jgi:hypothetical protein